MEHLLEKLDRDPDSHKGENGKVGIIGGSKDFTGAPSLSAKAALRTGCDLAKILTSEYSRSVVAGFSENFIVDSHPSGYLDERGMEKAEELQDWSDCCVIGPGLGDPDDDTIRQMVSEASKPLIIDAEAIQPALDAELYDAVFTPHRGEAEVIRERFTSIQDFVDEKEVVVVVKGQVDRIYSPEGVEANDTGDPTMTVGGTGDVLTGIIASLVSQGLDPEEAARLGCWIDGKAGELASEEYGNGALATDMIENIPEVIESN
ncbi:MAG: NAD(P)H-hydrate dehydratase [Candidatus Nanohaloarchaea archaeon]